MIFGLDKFWEACNIPDKVGIYGTLCWDERVTALLDWFCSWDCIFLALTLLVLCSAVAFIKDENWTWVKWLVWIVGGLIILVTCAVWFMVLAAMLGFIGGALFKRK